MKNIAFVFLFILIWMTLADHVFGLIGVEGMPYHKIPDIPLKLFIFRCIIAPLLEEVAYRLAPLMIAQSINEEIVLPIIMLSSFVFGMNHGHGYVSVLMQGTFGLALCWLYLRNGYWSCVLAHALWNVFCTVYF